MSKFSLFLKGLKNGMPIFVGYLAVSFTFGIAAKNAGITSWQAVLISATNFTSAGQFAAIDIIVNGLSYTEMALSQLIINLRYCLMSSSLSQRFDEKMLPIHRFLIAFGNTDEVFGVASSYPQGNIPPAYCYGIIAAALPGWISGTALGAISGSILPHRVLSALGVALYGMFIAIIVPPAKKNKVLLWIITTSMVLSGMFAILPVLNRVSSGFRVIILTVIIAGFAAHFFPINEEDKADEG